MNQKRSFIKNFWKDKKMVGSMTPSSRFLAKKMLAPIDFITAKVIIELGPGTGVFTRKIIENMHHDALFLVFELNDSFISLLQKKINDPRVHLIHDSAEKMKEYLLKFGVEKADAIISSLPLANFPEKLKNSLLQESHTVLNDNGRFIQFQYSLNAKKSIKKAFQRVSISFTPANFPPAFIYTCIK
jgi:phosphatidylethanolamine/phosphatidyl-N-methylethanolamine N-methyltransferase